MGNETLNKVRKGDVVAICVVHSATDAKMKTHRYERWVLATVYEASRAGLARRVVIAGSAYSVETARIGKVFTIPDGEHQAAAKRLVAASPYPAREYETASEIGAAVRAA